MVMGQLSLLSLVFGVVAIPLVAQDPPAGRAGNPQQRAESTRAFLGLGVAPDKAAAERGAPLYQSSCSFCHGPQARGAEGPNLVVSDVVLGDDHGEHLVPFLKQGRPDKGMPSFSSVPEAQLKDIAEFLHLQIEDVANRGTYHLLNIVVGDPTKGEAYVKANCGKCHTADTFAHIAAKYRTPDLLQRNWVWPTRPEDHSLAVTATVKKADGTTVAGRVTQVSDFKITLVDKAGKSTVIDRGPSVAVEMKDPLQAHIELIRGLKNNDIHDVTAYLETLK
jgi:cytochrome c oxidase cbb3-type subunit 3